MYGARLLTRLVVRLPLTTTISAKRALVRRGVRRRKWLLPPLVRTTLPDPVRRKRLAVALCVLSLVLPAFTLRGILFSLLCFSLNHRRRAGRRLVSNRAACDAA